LFSISKMSPHLKSLLDLKHALKKLSLLKNKFQIA